ncbi:hypothetical protein GCM10027299_55620 [Larkinella ripae]
MGSRVTVNLNSQKFSGSGRFSVVDQVDDLLVDGKPMQVNETVRLADRKYNLLKLTEDEALKKYGAKGRLVVEITLAE